MKKTAFAKYIKDEKRKFTPVQKATVLRLWEELNNAGIGAPTCAGFDEPSDGSRIIEIIWHSYGRSVDIQVNADGTWEWFFYPGASSGERGVGEEGLGIQGIDVLPPEMLKKFALLISYT